MLGKRLESRAVAVLAGTIALGGVACAGILGIDDRTLDPQSDGSTGEGGQPEGASDGTGGGPDGGGDGGGSDGAGDSTPPDGPSPGDDGGDAGCATDPCVLATGLNHPWSMTSDANNVYWTEFGSDLGSADGFVRGCPLTGCGSGPVMYGQALTNPRGITVDTQNVYFTTATYSSVVGGIWSCAIGGCGGSPTMLAPAGIPYGITTDATYVYWVDWDSNTVHRVLKTGGTDNVLYDAGDGIIVGPKECAVDNSNVFLTDDNSAVYRLPVGGGNPTTMTPGSGGGDWPIRLDSTNAYYGISGQIVRADKTSTDGGVPVAINVSPLGLALDLPAGKLYWADFGSGSANDGTVGRVTVDGGQKAPLHSSLVSPEDITVSGPYAFWVSSGTLDGSGGTIASTGQLLRTAK